ENKLRPPFAILLDLNMAGMNGHEFLDEVRKDAALRRTVIFVLSSSDAPEDIAAAYNRNVAGYVLKDDQAALERTVELVDRYSRLVVMPLGEPG
ncbi:MAG: response regulator, partial [Pseudomonadota bacterium]